MSTAGSVVAVILAAAVAMASDAPGLSFEEFAFDFLVQDVCVDAAGRPRLVPMATPLSGPAACSHHRDLAMGEPLPYHKHDWANENEAARTGGYQRSDSFPSLLGGERVVVQTFEFQRMHKAAAAAPGDGGQIVEVAKGDASVILTQDADGLKFFIGPDCTVPVMRSSLSHSWLLFDRSIQTDRSGKAIAALRQVPALRECPDGRDHALTVWRIRDLSYRKSRERERTGPLMTIVTEHYSRRTVDASDAMERMYLTRELGLTRWEAWTNLSDPTSDPGTMARRAMEYARTGRCDGGEGAPPGAGQWRLVDCREWTNLQPATVSAGDPPDVWISELRRSSVAGRVFGGR